MGTETIEEAQIIEEKKEPFIKQAEQAAQPAANSNTGSGASDTLARLRNLNTQKKTPGEATATSYDPDPKKSTAAGSSSKTKRDNVDWDASHFSSQSDDDDDEPVEDDDSDQQRNDQGRLRSGKPPLTHKTKLASARIFTRAFDSTQTLAFTFAHNKRLKKKFTEDEINIIDKYEDIPRKQIKEVKDLQALSKWDRIMKRHDEKIAEIAMTPEEKQDMTHMLMDYQDYTGETLSPAWGIGMSIGTVMVTRTIDLLTD